MDDGRRRALAATNLIAAFDLVRVHSADDRAETRRFGVVTAVRTGIDHAFYNPVLALGAGVEPGDVLAAVEWIESAGLPTSVQVAESLHGDAAAELHRAGFVANPDAEPIMVMDPVGTAPPWPPGVTVRSGGGELAEAWHAAAAWGDLGRRVFPASFMAHPAVRVAIGQLDGKDVAHAAAIRSGETIGIYAVGTREAARRRGLGRAVTWAVIEAGMAAWAGTQAVLQSSAMGLALYESMGFVEIDRYVEYARPKG
jgi:ribosomal protein S18 acetylase RimI-like enzyme